MRRFIATIRSLDGRAAELHIDLNASFVTLEGWAWHGDASIKNLIHPLPYEKERDYSLWLGMADQAASREGLEIEWRYEGEPWPPPDNRQPDKWFAPE